MKQSTKRIFAATMAALVVAAAGTTLTTQLPQLTNNVVHAEDEATQTFPVIQINVEDTAHDDEDYKIDGEYINIRKPNQIYELTGNASNKTIRFWGSNDTNNILNFYLRLNNVTTGSFNVYNPSGATLSIEVPKDTENHINSLNPNNLTITGSGKLYANSLGARGGLTIEDTTIETKVARNSDSWGGTCTLSGSANVTYIGNGTYAPLKLGEDSNGVHSLTLKDNAKLYCLQDDPDVASDGIADGLQVFGDANITLQGNSYLEAEGKNSTSEYGSSSGILAWNDTSNGYSPITIQVKDNATLKSTGYGDSISTNNFIVTGGTVITKSHKGAGVYADTIKISNAKEVTADGVNPGLCGSNTGNGITIDKSMVKATSSGSNGIYAPTVKISDAEVEAEGYYPALYAKAGGITIDKSMVKATSSDDSGMYTDGGNITIKNNSDVEAVSKTFRGMWSNGDLKIENSIVSAVTKRPESYWGAGANGTVSIKNSWLETVGGVYGDGDRENSVLFYGANGSVIGDATLPDSVTVAKGLTLTIPKDTTLTIPTDKTLTNEGTIVNQGKVIVNGTVTNNGTIDCTSHFSQSGTVCDLCGTSTVAPTPSAPSSVTTTETTTDPTTGTVTETVTTTHPDGSKTITKTETQTDGTKTVTKTETKPDGSKTETSTKTDKDGNVIEKTESKVEVKDDKSTVETTTTTKPGENTTTETVVEKDASGNVTRETTTTSSTNAEDLSKVIVEKEIYKNSRGTEVEKTTTTVINGSGATESVTVEHDIPNIGNKTDASIRTEKDGNGIVTIDKVGTMKENGMQATFTNKVVSQLKEAAGENLLLHMTVKDKDGNKRYSVEVNSADLTPKNKLYIYKKDSKTGALYMVNSKAYTTDSKGQLKLIIRSKGDFVLKNAEEAAKINKEILATVQVKNNKVTLEKGKTTTFAFSEELDMRNVKKITYTSSKASVATVNENGKIKGKKAGTTTITATVTLKNGDTKIVTMKVTVK